MTVSTVLICLMPESNKWLQARHIQKEASNGKIESIKYFMKSREIIKTTALLSFIFSASQMSLFGLTLSVDSRGHQTSRFVQNQFSNQETVLLCLLIWRFLIRVLTVKLFIQFGFDIPFYSVAGNVLANFAILGMVDALANIILCFASRWLTRRFLNVLSFSCLGVCCLIVGFIRLYASDHHLLAGEFEWNCSIM